MTWNYVWEQLRQPGPIIGGLLLSITLLAWIGYRVRRFAQADRPDDKLTNLAMLIGFGWSSDVVWELTGRLGWGWELRIPMFAILEMLLTIAMIRTKRNMRELGTAAEAGQSVWLITVGMSLVAALVSGSVPEAALRVAIPLFVTKTWWDGAVKRSTAKRLGTTSWRWTPRRLLLALGAIEPGERDVESVNRERVTQVMTRLEHRRQHGSELFSGRRAARLARLSLTVDDDIIGEVKRRVDRAKWFETEAPQGAQGTSPRSASTTEAASDRALRARHGRRIRALRVTHPQPVIVAAPAPRQDSRETQDLDLVVRVIKDAHPELSNTRIAQLVASSEPTVRRSLRRTQKVGATRSAKVNGHVPELESASS